MKESILNCIFYGGISKEEYKRVEKEIFSANLKNALVFSCLAFVAYIILLIQVSFSSILSIMARIYKISAVYYFILVVLTTVNIKLKRDFRLIPYIGICGSLILGAIIGIFVNSEAQTTTFIVFLFAVPLLFTIRPIAVSLVIIISDFIYIYLVVTHQSGAIYANNLSNAVVYGIMSVLFSSYMMNLKIRALAHAKNYKFLMGNDQLTGLNNRLSFDRYLEKLKEKKISCLIMNFDINGLKRVNDTKGHKAGDELIVAAAQCILKTFSPYGSCFRIGGDEFVAILDGYVPSKKDLCEQFEENLKSWKIDVVEQLSVAYGIVRMDDYVNSTLEEKLLEVDSLMYKNKEEYYSSNDRMR
ncbi:MAG: diguanylate cyclase [Treponema sp.]|uniref:GGDEF domain-containing protein n=1 Tax=Treponema sp. TaxID=166 RepID=UPI00298D87C9|nr:diguanylate cyclase [Treponema sp.]MBR5933550.1 diguanylate cyclase [Treponema sp.]